MPPKTPATPLGPRPSVATPVATNADHEPSPLTVPAPASAPPDRGGPSVSLLDLSQLGAIAATDASSAKLALLAEALGVRHYAANPRTLVWVDFLFGVVCFGLEEAQFAEPLGATRRLVAVAHEVFAFATTIVPEPPTLEATYELFAEQIRALSIVDTSTAGAPTWSPAEVARVVGFFSSTLFRHLGAYQLVFAEPRACVVREIPLVVESPLPPPPLGLATSLVLLPTMDA